MANKWHEIWNNRITDLNKIAEGNSSQQIFLELKRSSGFDVLNDGMSYEAFYQQYLSTKEMLINKSEQRFGCSVNSVYEVGCGSGANLFLLQEDGYDVGGIDFSEKLIEAARKVLHVDDLQCGEANTLSSEKKYDVLLSNSVFSYFADEAYATNVLEKMYRKTRYAIGLIDIHDLESKDAFIQYRKREVPNYEERYKELPKFFYEKSFFVQFAREHDMDIVFTKSEVEGYWNNNFVFNCFMYKKA